ncbi:NBS-LRR resistance-like protein [Artemisia annua]|uniref:NBS-LRR resistance-like protein n=1 Tax=Artemisia annua TaxID=35608 RepID=A0A2U1KK01_ARTAN|nr:NBS-LRR resistance-like protein [Artemisia annua]
MAEIVLSALLTVVFEKLSSTAVNKIARSKKIHSELKKWESSLSMIQALLMDASQKEVTDEVVKRWLNSLEHLAYDIDDVLDTLATEAMHHEFVNESEALTNKVRKLIPSCCTSFPFNTRMISKLDNITTKLQELVAQKNDLGLSVKTEQFIRNKNRSYQTSVGNLKGIVGREGDKKVLLDKLLGDDQCNENFSIVPIVGMGGMGKTTLARLLYDDKKVKDHFELKAWVCVSEDFDSFKISEEIFQSVSGESKKFKNLNLLQEALRDQLVGKRFLLVLDDVWSDKIEDWETLVGPFYAGAPGSKIIITTRKKELLRQLGHDHPYDLRKLSHNDALALFAQHALGEANFDSHLTLREHGEGIVKKCDGLPLALRALGCLLRTKIDEEEWKEVLNDEIWRLQDGGDIVPALRLSYQELSACVKQLFAYCSLLPKDCVFEKEDLILLWMAEGFLRQSNTSKSMERLGEEYFEELLSRSFFQAVPGDESLFVMHDLINDLATYVAGDFFARLDIDMEKDFGKDAPKQYRHMSVIRERYISYKKFKAFERAKSLRTLLVVPVLVRDSSDYFFLSSKVMVDLIPELPYLRVLCLSHLQIDEVPESVGKLKHLRYLNLSRTEITHLPEDVCNLFNLQTLIVFGCSKLTKLPDSFLKLKNLRHFDIRGTSLLKKMPLGIGELKNLHLSKIIIGGDSNFAITGLKNLKNFHRKVSIHGLDKVQNAPQAQELNFSQKGFSALMVEWSDVFDGSRNETLEKEVLDALKPRNEYLKDLDVVSYGGIDFPNWIGDPSFLWLTSVSITSCKKCLNLPSLGQLSSLKKLLIKDLDKVKVVGPQLLGTGPAFPSLEFLSFEGMPLWEEWSSSSDVIGGVFPCLQELTLDNCPNLAKVSLEALRSLRILKIKNCGGSVLRSLIRVAPSVTKLNIDGISGLTDGVWRDVMGSLRAVEEVKIEKCHEIKYLWESEAEASKVFVNLRKLKLRICEELVSLGEKEEENDNSGCNHLTSLKIVSCKNLERFSCPDNIESLTIDTCDSIKCVSFPTGGCQKLKSLMIVFCNQLSEKELEKVLPITSTSMLESVGISLWPNLKSVNELTKFIRLTDLLIINCPSIESFPADVLPTFTSLKRLIIMGCENMDVASFGLWPPNLGFLQIGGLKKPISQCGTQTFPTSLVDLTLLGGTGEEDDVIISASQLSHMLPSSLTNLNLWEFKKLESVSKGLQHLTSLQHLHISNCPKMKDLPETLLPSLLSLEIWECPDEMKEKTSRRGSYWPLISYIPRVTYADES